MDDRQVTKPSVPEAPRPLAGGETTGLPRERRKRPGRDAGIRLFPAPLPGCALFGTSYPVVSPPANSLLKNPF